MGAGTEEELDRLVAAYLADLEKQEDETWEELDELMSADIERSWRFATRVVQRVPDDFLSMVGVSVLGSLLNRQPSRLADRFDSEIRGNERFFKAFQYASMTGVPLTVQRRLNAALIEKGADPKFVGEYDEDGEDDT